jgi:hypothetical protein
MMGRATCYGVHIVDQRPDPTCRTGGMVNVAKPMAMINAGNHWNTFDITAQRPAAHRAAQWTLTMDVEDKRLARGPFALQANGGTVRFRSVRIR